MNEGRVVLLVFALFGVAMIGVPVATVLTAARPGAGEAGDKGEISRAFLAADGVGAEATPMVAVPMAAVPTIAAILPKGMAEKTVFEKFAASGFTCATDADAATCYRSHEAASCTEDWKVRVIFSDDGSVWSDTAERRTTCL